MRYILVLFLIISTLFIYCERKVENPYETPESTIKEFATAMKEGDFERAIKCYSQDSLVSTNPGQEDIPPDILKSLFLSSLEAGRKPFIKGEITIEDVKYSAVVKFKVGNEERQLPMIKEEDGWKIATNL